jgi:solute carrier family 35 protein C2
MSTKKTIGFIFSDLAILFSSVSKETEFDFWGFIFVTLAAVMSGFRWSMTQILLQVSVLTEFYPFSCVAMVNPTFHSFVSLMLLG